MRKYFTNYKISLLKETNIIEDRYKFFVGFNIVFIIKNPNKN